MKKLNLRTPTVRCRERNARDLATDADGEHDPSITVLALGARLGAPLVANVWEAQV